MHYILFFCGHNSGRSQMAEAYFNHHNKNPKLKAISAGTHPGNTINKNVQIILLENGIDISDRKKYYPKLLTLDSIKKAEEVYTMGCNVDCKIINKPIKGDFNLSDPHDKSVQEVRHIYQELKEKMNPVLKYWNK